MNINGTIALNPTDGRKSFYGKAVVLLCSNGDKILRSYATNVAKIDSSGNFHKLWDGYSATTMRHINSFVDTFGINGGGKKWWESLTAERG
jgi:hypothetical protein